MDVDGECRRRDLVGGGGGHAPREIFFLILPSTISSIPETRKVLVKV